MSAFKAYDIRGVWGKDFNEDTVYKIGYFLPELLNTDHVVVGRDVRASSPVIHDRLVEGITDRGADVWDLGLSTTPMVYWATTHLNADASVQITASHNPAEYNGLKISRTGALPVGGNSGLKDLEKMVNEKEVVPSEKKGSVKDYSFVRDEYVEYFLPLSKGLEDLNISLDCSNGMSNLVIKDILANNKNIHYIYDYFDGTFPNHEPNPLEEKNCRDLEKEVIKNKSDVGVIYDGDADRVIFVDDKGQWIQPDYVTAVLGYYYGKQGRKGNALCDIRTSKSTTDYLEKNGWNCTLRKECHSSAMSKSKKKKRRTLPAHTEPAAPPKTGDPEKTGEDVSRGARWMAALCYLNILILIPACCKWRHDDFVRFHLNQGLVVLMLATICAALNVPTHAEGKSQLAKFLK